MKIRRKNKGFTLIELLVVIAIIALLMSIIMPALSAIKKQATQVVCMTNLSQWGLVLTLYTEDNDGHFFAGTYDYTDPNGMKYTNSDSDLWPYALEPYYQLPKLSVCPGGPFKVPDIHNPAAIEKEHGNLSGGYGLNGWVCDTPAEILEVDGRDMANSWRTMDQIGSAKIPLMADSRWYTGRPKASDLPPVFEQVSGYRSYYHRTYGDLEDILNDPSNQMQRFAVDWHRGRMNVLFMDGAVNAVSPKKLWRLKWHKNFDTSAPLPEWPEWMIDCKDP